MMSPDSAVVLMGSNAEASMTSFILVAQMVESTNSFYDDLAEDYHLIFEDWERSVQRQAAVLGPLLKQYTETATPYVLDCACGIGTQTLGLTKLGFPMVASDASRASVRRAAKEAHTLGLDVPFRTADMRDLSEIAEIGFDAVLAADNALPHLLSQEDLVRALSQMNGKLKRGGIVLATLRDYDSLIATRPTAQTPAFYGTPGRQRIIHQVWQWEGDRYVVHLYITLETPTGWKVNHYAATYRALLRSELNQALHLSGFSQVKWLEPKDTSFYQPIVVARKASKAHLLVTMPRNNLSINGR
jgi:SAM-dependent methyltransferase